MKFGRRTSKDDDGTPAADVNHPEDASEGSPQRGRGGPRGTAGRRSYLDGQMLIAMPSMGDDRFARSVIYVCAHSTEGAMGIIVNQPAAHISFSDLLVQLDVIPAA